MPDPITPFRIEVPDAELDDLRDRLRRTRWPEREPVEDWSQGVPLGYLQQLCAYWADEYDWRTTEARLNALPQFRIEIDGLGIHFLHARSPHADALPLVLTHGWPGSIVEFLEVIGPLADPPAHDGDASDAFHVVCPSLPGYGFSDKPAQTGWGIERIAAAWTRVMASLGYERYGAAGSDWGTSISTFVAQQDPDHVAGIHLIPPLAPPDPATFDDLTERERAAIASLEHSAEWDSGYSKEHATRPQTIGYALVDSPTAPVRLDHREVLGLDRLRRSPRERDRTRRAARQPDAVLAAPHRRLRRPALLAEHPPGQRMDHRIGGRSCRPARRLLDLSQGAPAPLAAMGRATLHRHPPLE
jgi:pimeloyl-ACP methyl ester carboxylesterase